MNAKDFINSLRKVIREEVQSAVRSEISKLQLNESSVHRVVQPPARPPQSYNNSFKPQGQQKVKKQFTENSLLNDLLNETMGFNNSGVEDINYNDYSDWPTLEHPGLAGVGYNAAAPTRGIPDVIEGVDGMRVSTAQLAKTEAGAAVLDALTRDYSAVLKAAKEKSKIGR